MYECYALGSFEFWVEFHLCAGLLFSSCFHSHFVWSLLAFVFTEFSSWHFYDAISVFVLLLQRLLALCCCIYLFAMAQERATCTRLFPSIEHNNDEILMKIPWVNALELCMALILNRNWNVTAYSASTTSRSHPPFPFQWYKNVCVFFVCRCCCCCCSIISAPHFAASLFCQCDKNPFE